MDAGHWLVTRAGERLDLALAEPLPHLSRSRVAALIGAGAILLNGRVVKPAAPVRPGDRVSWSIPDPTPAAPRAQAIALDVLYEDADLIALNKPPGLVVHPGAGVPDGTLVNALLHHCHDLAGVGGVARPGIVHRLDRGTSGVLVVAKHDQAHQALARQFAQRSTRKEYRALVLGVPPRPAGTWDTPYGRHPTQRTRYSGRVHSARRAITHYRVAAAWAGAAELEVRIETGRTHQIRVHLYEAGTPIIGESTYARVRLASLPAALADAWRAAPRPMLHAAALVITHPRSGATLALRAPIPDDYQAVRALLAASTPPG